MSIDAMIAQARRLGLIEEEAPAPAANLPLILVCPSPADVPADGVFEYDFFTDVASFVAKGANCVRMVQADQYGFLSAFASSAAVFGYEVISVIGVPSAEYDQDYADATFRCQKWSYMAVVAEMNEHREIDRVRDGQRDLSVHEKERAQFTRSDGTVRSHGSETVGVYDGGEE